MRDDVVDADDVDADDVDADVAGGRGGDVDVAVDVAWEAMT